ncbi:BGTF surface domain-containing protein [Halobacteriaceae archaeon GCM10025711]
MTAGENGTFSAAFDFSGVPNGTEFTVSVHAGSQTLTEADGRLDSSPPTTTASDGQPGFTAVLGVLALVGTALLAMRGRE